MFNCFYLTTDSTPCTLLQGSVNSCRVGYFLHTVLLVFSFISLRLEKIENRALARRPGSPAGSGQFHKGAFHVLQGLYFAFNICCLFSCPSPDHPASGLRIDPQRKKLGNFTQRESQCFCSFNKVYTSDCFLGIQAIAGLAASRLGDEASPLIVSDGLNIQFCSPG